MIHRIRQFLYALFGRLDQEGIFFVRCYLNQSEFILFKEMHPADQFHSFRVAMTAKKLYQEKKYYSSDDYIFLIRCSLLHDIGRVKGTTDIWGIVFAVICNHFFPNIILSLTEKSIEKGLIGKIGMALYIYKYHPQIGSKKLRKIGSVREAEIIELHQKEITPEDSLVLSILKVADSLN